MAYSRRRFSINVMSNVSVYMVNLVIGLWFTPYLIRNLGVAAYGLIPLATSITSYLTLITLSINGAVGRFLTIEIQNHNFREANKIFNTAFAGLSTIAVVSLPILIGMVMMVPYVFNIPNGNETSSKILFLLVFLSFFVTEVDTCFAVSSWAKSRFDLRNIVVISSNIVRVLIIVVFFTFLEPSVAYIGAGMLLATLTGLVGDYILWRLLTPELSISPSQFDWGRIRELFGMGGWVVINHIGSLLFLNIDLIVVNIILGAKTAGEYGSILLFSALLRGIAGAVAGVLYPTIIAKYAQHDLDSVTLISSRAVHLMVFAVGLPVGLLCGLGGPFLKLWLGPGFGRLWPLLILMVCHLPLNLAVTPLFGIQMAQNKVKIPGIMTLIMGLGNLLLAILFSMVLNWGPYGIAAAAAIALTSKNAIFTLLYGAHIQRIPWYTFIHPILPGILLTIVMGLISWWGAAVFNVNNWVSLILAGSAFGGIGILLIYLFGLEPGEKALILDFLSVRKI